MPVFGLFFPLPLAIGLTAIVHLSNNLFKLVLLGKFANKEIVIKFGLPAITAAYFGDWCLRWFYFLKPVGYYNIGSQIKEITYLNLALAVLMITFALFERLPYLQKACF